MISFAYKNETFTIAESEKEMLESIFTRKHHLIDAWIKRKYKNRIDFEMIGYSFSVTHEGTMCYKSDGHWFYAILNHFGTGAEKFNLYGLGDALWKATTGRIAA